MKKALIVTSVSSMIKQFNLSNIEILQELGYEVTIATNFEEAGNIPYKESKKLYRDLIRMKVKPVNVSFHRNPTNTQNIKAYKQIKSLIEIDFYHLIHCQSPIGGILTRIAANKTRSKGTKVIYTAHGFHFYKGAPMKNWLFYYPIEKVMSNLTDILITINSEDYNLAIKKNHTNHVERIPGVGIDVQKFSSTDNDFKEKRKELNIPCDCYLILSVGELNDNKNHKIIIESLDKINNPSIHYAITGLGDLSEELKRLVDKYDLANNVHFLGYRNQIQDVYQIADVFAFPSKREGLGISAVEAMASGLPIITSNVHGILDYSKDGETGFTFSPYSIDETVEAIEKIYNLTEQEIKKISVNNRIKAKEYDQSVVNKQMKKIYESVIME